MNCYISMNSQNAAKRHVDEIMKTMEFKDLADKRPACHVDIISSGSHGYPSFFLRSCHFTAKPEVCQEGGFVHESFSFLR